MGDISLGPLSPGEVRAQPAPLASVYTAAFAQPPYCETPDAGRRFEESLAVHTSRSGFRMRIARSPEGGLVGFGYGYTSAAGQRWHDRAAAALGPAMAERWLAGAFELVELAVVPAAQGQGIGGGLHDALLDGLPHPAAVLGVVDADIPARRLYRSRGWRPIGRLPPTSAGPFAIMALDLSRRRAVGSAG